MRVEVIGSSGTFPTLGRPASGYLISHGSTNVWCDAGFGTFAALPIDPDLVDAIVLSHQHPDHCADLAAAFHAWTYRPEPRTGVPVFAPAAVWERLGAFMSKDGAELSATFDFDPVSDGEVRRIGEIGVTFVEMHHSVPTVGSRWEVDNKALFYTGDTGPGGDWTRGLADVDVLLAEASYQETNKNPDYPFHMSAAEAAKIAREAGVDRLVLTHIPPYLDIARSVHEAELVFDRPVSVAVPGAGFDV